MQLRVRELFEILMSKKEGEDFVRIDAGKAMEVVQEEIRTHVDKCIQQVDREEDPSLRVVGQW